MKSLANLFAIDNGAARNIDNWFRASCTLSTGCYESNFQLWHSWAEFATQNDMHKASPKRLAMYFRFRGLTPARLASGSVRVWRGVRLKASHTNNLVPKINLCSHIPTHVGERP